MNESIERILFSEEDLKNACKKMGRQITEDYKGKNPLLVGILKGSITFMADLMREIDLDCEIDFMVAQSYGDSAVSSGVVQIKKDLETDIKDRDVIIIEDILDSARTLYNVKHTLMERGPASIKIATLLDKNVERAVDLKSDYKCFDIENEFVVGYGLDYAQQYRCLPYIGILKREVYEK